MKLYLDKEAYVKLTDELRAIVERRMEPTESHHFAFGFGYDGHLENMAFLKIYSSYLMEFPKCTVKDLHALCLGYGTAASVLDIIANEDSDDNKTYH